MRIFDTSFDYRADRPAKSKPDADRDSPRLRADHELLWTKSLRSGALFAPTAPRVRRDGYLIFTDAAGVRHWYGSDAITHSYAMWSKPKTLVAAKAALSVQEEKRYLDSAYTIGSAMIWPVRSADRPTINQARCVGPTGRIIRDRIDLTLECIRRHYNKKPNTLGDVLNAYSDFFALFRGFEEFVEFFHFGCLVAPDLSGVVSLMRPGDLVSEAEFEREATPTTRDEYIAYREATMRFIDARGRLMADWVSKHHVGVSVNA